MEERKVVTVLFADLVGFTARAETLDPEDVRGLLRPYHERGRVELERFGGTVEKFIGDAVMAVFGAPVAHEDDPERAVRAALALRDAVAELNEAEPSPELELRIAVHTGEALVTVDADPARGEGFVAGDVVNTASRLQGFAPVNGVLVGESTYRSTEHAIAYREAEAVHARGRSEPTRVWEALNPISRIGTDPRREGGAPLVGRSRELDQLRDTLARALDEPSVQLVTLVGVPGMGKSRLVRELLASVEADVELLVRWRQGRSLPYGEGVTFWALGEIVKAEAGILETDTADVSDTKLARAVSTIAEPGEAAWIVRHLHPLVGLAGNDPQSDGEGEAFTAWRRFLEGLAEDGPTVLVFEDLHWADDSMLDFIDELVDQATDLPLLVVATARPELLEQRPSWGGGKRNATTISLAPLSRDDTARLLATLLETPLLAADVQSRVLERAEGNPLFAEEYARLLEQGGVADDLPESLQGLIAARLDALGPEEKAAVQASAVLGETFWAGAVAAVAANGRTEVVLRGLERKEFVRRRRRSSVEGETEYAFQHALVRDVAYAQIPRGERGERHARAAAWVGSLGRPDDHAEMLAHHYVEALELARASGRPAAELEDRARRALVEAGGRAFSLGALLAARRFYEGALALTQPENDSRPALLLRYAWTRADDEEVDTEMLESAYDGLLRQGAVGHAAEAKTLLTSIWWARGDRDRAFEQLARANELVADEPESSSKASVLTQVARYEMLAGEFDRAQRIGREAAEMAERLGLPALLSRTLNTAGVSRVESGDPGGLDDLARAVDIARGVNDPLEEFQAASNLTWMIVVLGDIRRAWDLHLQDCELAERFGLAPHIRWERGERLFYLYWRGEWSEVPALARAFLEDVAGSGHYLEAQVLGALARIGHARGEVHDALGLARTAVERGRGAGDPQIVHATLALSARLLADAGDQARAAPLLDELLEASQNAELVKVGVPIDAAWAGVALGRAEELLRIYAPVEDRSRWLVAAAAIAAGEFVRAADVLEEIGSLPDTAYARLRAAEQFVRAGDRARADEQLLPALAFLRSVGATAYVREGEALLARAG
jgi:class 3 adenylate cyclase/tetratricopeptide (TPR) repeat protein